MDYTEIEIVESRRFYLGSIFFVEVVQSGAAGTEIWIGRDRDRQVFYQGYNGRIFEDMSDAKLKEWIEMDRVLDLINARLSYPDECWEIDRMGTLSERNDTGNC